MIGRVDLLDARRAVDHWKAQGSTSRGCPLQAEARPDVATFNCETAESRSRHGARPPLIELRAAGARERQAGADRLADPQYDRTVGAMLSGEVAAATAMPACPTTRSRCSLTGTAGQSFGAFLAHGVTLELNGEANDYVGKGLSGGRIVILPPPQSKLRAEENIIVGNTVPLRRHRGRMLLLRRRRRALRRAQFGRDRGGRGRRRSWLRVYDRRHRRGDRRDRPQFRRRHERRHRLCARRGWRFRTPLQPCRWSNSAAVGADAVAKKGGGNGAARAMPSMSSPNDGRRCGPAAHLIENHRRYTNGARAPANLLQNWEYYMPKFVKVMPVDYKAL